jgi:hypothetical protein
MPFKRFFQKKCTGLCVGRIDSLNKKHFRKKKKNFFFIFFFFSKSLHFLVETARLFSEL